tara:strand:+ start:51 stop:506 length:456 start_codon:yes stop_codon:yes gene_type:complete
MNKSKSLLAFGLGSIACFIGVQALLESGAWLVFSTNHAGAPILGILALTFPSLGLVVGPVIIAIRNRPFAGFCASCFFGLYLIIATSAAFIDRPLANTPERLKDEILSLSIAHLLPILLLVVASVILLIKPKKEGVSNKTTQTTSEPSRQS